MSICGFKSVDLIIPLTHVSPAVAVTGTKINQAVRTFDYIANTAEADVHLLITHNFFRITVVYYHPKKSCSTECRKEEVIFKLRKNSAGIKACSRWRFSRSKNQLRALHPLKRPLMAHDRPAIV